MVEDRTVGAARNRSPYGTKAIERLRKRYSDNKKSSTVLHPIYKLA